ncbi:MAG: hypothetical protein AABY88_09605 [Pseudomonadota bacterium]
MIFALKVAGMLAGVLILTGLARWLKLGGEARICSADHARALARLTHYGFDGVAAVVDTNGQAALVRGADNHHILIRARGPRFISRMLDADTQTRLDPGHLTISVNEPDFPTTMLNLGDEASRWAATLERPVNG